MKSYSPGSLVKVRDREWVVLPSEDENLLLIKPLGGSEEEISGIYLPLAFESDEIQDTEFPYPTVEDLGDIRSAKILYNAARLSFRHGAGPFRCIAKLSFRPRAYQMVPLIMALRQEIIRLFIADDVGLGKTIEALLVAKELLERRKIKRFAVICLPHLCEQWQSELKGKFDIDAVIVRSNTQARLDRDIPGDASVYQYYPYQVISIDYIKMESRRNVFINECPELVIVDEVHACAKPYGANNNQQQRHSLLHNIAIKDQQHLIMVTATPHSGKPEEFQSLLGLLNKDFEKIDMSQSTQKQRNEVSKYFVQRRRADVCLWMNENTVFPEREAGEFSYALSNNYDSYFQEILKFAKKLIKTTAENQKQKRIHYWTVLGLMRGVMSSPRTGIQMMRNRMQNLAQIDDDTSVDNPILDNDFSYANDYVPAIEKKSWSKYQQQKFRTFVEDLEKMCNIKDDRKAAITEEIIDDWLRQGYHPIIFCRYIATANYLGEILQPVLQKKHKNLHLQVITSEDPDEMRRERINNMKNSSKRLLIATDCLSEGINLQDFFTAVLHYDLPWNPNRLEQREGRVDRFGQRAKKVKTYILYGTDNPIDGVVFNVLLKKIREIHKSIGITIPFPENSQTILDTVLQSILLAPGKKQEQQMFNFGENDALEQQKIKATRAIEEAAEREKKSRSIFAQNAIKYQEIEQDLKQVDEAIGNPEAVEEFFISTTEIFGTQIDKSQKGYSFHTTNLPEILKSSLPQKVEQIAISFASPTPEGYSYLGRNNIFIEQVCNYILMGSMNNDCKSAARAAVVRDQEITKKTTIFLFRVRNVIEAKRKQHQLVAEEMHLWGYEGLIDDRQYLNHEAAKHFITNVRPSANMTKEQQISFLQKELEAIPNLQDLFDQVAQQRAEHLVEAHERFSKVVGSHRYQVVYPVLPMDVIGIYVLLPQPRSLLNIP